MSNNNYSIFGEEIRIRKGKDDEYFKFYITRYENGICTLIRGCDTRVEALAAVAKIMEQDEMECSDEANKL